MSMQYSTTYRNVTQLDGFATLIGASPHLYIASGAQPANCAAADTGTTLVDITCPATPFAAAAGGSMAKNGTWQGTASAGSPTNAGHFRLKTSGGTCHAQGSITATGGGGDMEFDNISIATGQQVTINTFTLSAGGA